MVAQAGTHCDLYALQCVHHQQTKASVKVVQARQILQGRTFSKTVLGIVRALKRAHIRSEAKETDRLKETRGSRFILNGQPAFLEQCQLIVNIYRGFLEWLHAVDTNSR